MWHYCIPFFPCESCKMFKMRGRVIVAIFLPFSICYIFSSILSTANRVCKRRESNSEYYRFLLMTLDARLFLTLNFSRIICESIRFLPRENRNQPEEGKKIGKCSYYAIRDESSHCKVSVDKRFLNLLPGKN